METNVCHSEAREESNRIKCRALSLAPVCTHVPACFSSGEGQGHRAFTRILRLLRELSRSSDGL